MIRDLILIPYLSYNLNNDLSNKILEYFTVDNLFNLDVYNKYKFKKIDNINNGNKIVNSNLNNKDIIRISYLPNSFKYFDMYPELYKNHYGLLKKDNNVNNHLLQKDEYIYNINLKRIFVIQCNNLKSYFENLYNDDIDNYEINNEEFTPINIGTSGSIDIDKISIDYNL